MAGQITFVKVLNTGLGYSHATVTIKGTGTGAVTKAIIAGGKIIGIQVTSFGSGYGAGTTVTITGDGVGAAATAQVGLAPWQNKELSIDCLASVTFAAAGSSPVQSNWTGVPITVPANATIDWIGRDRFLLTYGDILLRPPTDYALLVAAFKEDGVIAVKDG